MFDEATDFKPMIALHNFYDQLNEVHRLLEKLNRSITKLSVDSKFWKMYIEILNGVVVWG